MASAAPPPQATTACAERFQDKDMDMKLQDTVIAACDVDRLDEAGMGEPSGEQSSSQPAARTCRSCRETLAALVAAATGCALVCALLAVYLAASAA